MTGLTDASVFLLPARDLPRARPTSALPRALAPLANARLHRAVVLFGLHGEVRARCEDAARDLGLPVVAARHLEAACRALGAESCALLVASSSARPWDRQIAAEHAARAGVRVKWADDQEDPDLVADAVRACAARLDRLPRRA